MPAISDPWESPSKPIQPRQQKSSVSDPWLTPSTLDTPKAGYVYVIQDMQTGMYKIGRTTNLDRRMKELGGGVSAKLVKAKFYPDCHKVETQMHKRYANSRLPGTEYFRLSKSPYL